MTIHARSQTNASKQTTLLDGIDGGPRKQGVCWRGLNRPVHESMNNISNVKVHLKTRSGNVNIFEKPQYSCFTVLFVSVSNSYAIKNLENERKYLVNADIHVCFETRANCIHEFTILSDALFQKEDCNGARGFVEPG